MLNGSKIITFLRNELKAEADNTVTLLENNLFTTDRYLSPFQQFLERETEASCLWFKNLVKCVSPHTGTISIMLS